MCKRALRSLASLDCSVRCREAGVSGFPLDLGLQGGAAGTGGAESMHKGSKTAGENRQAPARRVAGGCSGGGACSGCGDGVVAVHISTELSSTLGAAQHAAREFDGAVRVVDSRSAGMGTGFVALAAARAARDGADLNTVVAQAESTVPQVRAYLVVQRLENLRRSGRIGAAASWLGTALSLKPLLRIDDGKLVLAQRVRTTSKATVAMVEQVLAEVGEHRAALAVHHVDNPGAAAEVAATLASALPACRPALVTDLGPVLGVHLGPGAIGVVLARPVPDRSRPAVKR